MQTLTFDENGYLMPYEKIEIDLTTLQHYFVDAFPDSTKRKVLFDNYLRYVEQFSKEITSNFTQWINGSFVTQKEEPNDIDIVTFLDEKYYIKDEEDTSLDKYYSFSWYDRGIDAYIVGDFSKGTQKYTDHTLYFKEQWFNLFTKNRANDSEIIFPKGFLEIQF
jgi:hypothetical protein